MSGWKHRKERESTQRHSRLRCWALSLDAEWLQHRSNVFIRNPEHLFPILAVQSSVLLLLFSLGCMILMAVTMFHMPLARVRKKRNKTKEHGWQLPWIYSAKPSPPSKAWLLPTHFPRLRLNSIFSTITINTHKPIYAKVGSTPS